MRCRACDRLLSETENSRKYLNWQDMPEGEDRYIGLCSRCLEHTDLHFVEINFDDSGEIEDDEPASDSEIPSRASD